MSWHVYVSINCVSLFDFITNVHINIIHVDKHNYSQLSPMFVRVLLIDLISFAKIKTRIAFTYAPSQPCNQIDGIKFNGESS